ncbi:MAG: DEAD/DEAH box helicase [Planctomycetes bacterium]|jgi:ATP-dependent RNA helicase DeaD|nr:DEAD/DEAH box helicase [Planctomycetota bacterium]MCP4838169.1 DEAD/DEAH box helicase [Planctomycetota bacterium]
MNGADLMSEIFDTQRSFSDLGLKPEVLSGIAEVGFEHPTHVQSELIPLAIAGRDVMGQSRTGTGKTAAFGLPILHLLEPGDAFGALCLVPTRELAIQVAREMDVLGKNTGLHKLAVYGGQKIDIQAKRLQRRPEIIVGTPGRVMDMNRRGMLPYDRLRIAVLDEVDRMLDIGFREDIRKILGTIKHKHQTIFVSATISDEIERLARKYMRNPENLSTVDAKSLTVSQVQQRYVTVHPWDKRRLLKHIIEVEDPELGLVFCRTKATVDKVAGYLCDKNINAAALHADMHQSKRNRVMEQLRGGDLHIVVASDVAARGIDVDGITHVFNLDIPEDPEVYVHRIGRTARTGRSGQAIMFVEPEQGPLLMGVERLTNVEITEVFYDAFEPGPEPRKVRERRAQIDQDRETNKQNLSRSVKQAPDAESAEDAERFPGGIVPSALPKKRMGGRLRGRRR